MRVVVLSPYAPHAKTTHAGGAYLHAYLTLAAAEREVTVVAPDTEENRLGRDVHGTGAAVHLVRVRRSGRMLTRLRNYRQGLTPGADVLRGFLEDDHLKVLLMEADLVEVHWSYLLPLLPLVPEGTPVVAFPHDVVSQVLSRRAASLRNPLARSALDAKARRVARQEVHWLRRVQSTFVFSEKDARLLRDQGLRGDVSVIAPLVEPAPTAAALTGSTVLFVGAMGRPENVDGVNWFLRECWPRVLQEVPIATLMIAGADPPSSLTGPRVTVTGFVDDLRPYYASARLSVAPLRRGAGLKFKVAQSLVWGLPSVATTVGAEGLPAHVLACVSDDPSRFAEACIRVLQDDEFAHEVGSRARAWATRTYDFAASVRSVLDATRTETRS